MGVILDTSLLIAAERGDWDMAAFIQSREEESFGLSVISVSELLQGVHRANSKKRHFDRIEGLEFEWVPARA